MSPTPRPLVIKTTSGTDRPEATNQAFTVAAAAVAAGAEVSLWLTGESAWFALPGRAADLVLEHADPAGRAAGPGARGRPRDGVHAVRRPPGHRPGATCCRASGSPAAAVFVEESLAERRPGARLLGRRRPAPQPARPSRYSSQPRHSPNTALRNAATSANAAATGTATATPASPRTSPAPVMIRPTSCANVGGRGSSSSVGGARRGRTSLPEHPALPGATDAAERAEREARDDDGEDGVGGGRGAEQEDGDEQDERRGRRRTAGRGGRCRRGRRVRTGVLMGTPGGARRDDGVRSAGVAARPRPRSRLRLRRPRPDSESSAASACRRSVAPDMRPTTTPRASSRSVVGVRMMPKRRTRSRCSTTSISTCERSSCSETSCASTAWVRRQGAQTSLENCTNVARVPSGAPSSAAVRRESSASSSRCGRQERGVDRGVPAVARPPPQAQHGRDDQEGEDEQDAVHASAHQDPADDVHEDARHGDREGDGRERRPAPLERGQLVEERVQGGDEDPDREAQQGARQGVDRREQQPAQGTGTRRGPGRDQRADPRLAGAAPPRRTRRPAPGRRRPRSARRRASGRSRPSPATATATSVPATVPDTDSTSRVRPSRRRSSLTNASRIAAAKTTGRSRRYGWSTVRCTTATAPTPPERHDRGGPGLERQPRQRGPAEGEERARGPRRCRSGAGRRDIRRRRRRRRGRPSRPPGWRAAWVPYRPATGVTGEVARGAAGRAVCKEGRSTPPIVASRRDPACRNRSPVLVEHAIT